MTASIFFMDWLLVVVMEQGKKDHGVRARIVFFHCSEPKEKNSVWELRKSLATKDLAIYRKM
jgi:hypothetical protein